VGATTNSRYRILDGIPLEKELRFDMELWHWAATRIDYAPAGFWYARPGGGCNVAPDPAAAARKVSRLRSDVVEVFRIPGALEAEALVPELAPPEDGGSAGRVEVQTAASYGWSDEAQLWWMDGALGARLGLGFDAPAQGRYRVTARLTRANDYARVGLALNSVAAGEWDRYHPVVESTDVELGEFELIAAHNLLVVTLVGRNPAALPRHMFGLDALVLTAVP